MIECPELPSAAGLELGYVFAAEHIVQPAAFSYHDMDTLYRHFSHFGNGFGEAAGERPFLLVAPAFADVALDDGHGGGFLRLLFLSGSQPVAEREPAEQPRDRRGRAA
jgi:hypothetical protein